ncbi:MAG: exodeoxyribonuclease VII large subunit [Spirochaetales bacterium]|nr:exodeoxyribonuclease VII large subunit [Spirochaetales bacterium]
MKFSVSDLTARIKNLLEGSFSEVEVEGEISNCRFSSTGHLYFSLKDNNAKLACALFRADLARIPFMPEDGQMVLAGGSVSVYPPSGNYQLICRSLRVAGQGEILKMIEARKQKFAAMGYFDPGQKKQLPRFPRCVVLVTSPTGAAVRDILHVINRRNSRVHIRILPAAVQGPGAATQIARQIRLANRYRLGDVIITGRGGGSIEDLLPFSEEAVIEAIHDSEIPVVSAVGHQIDTALSDYAADVHAPTPSAAAELVTGELDGVLEHLRRAGSRLSAQMHKALRLYRMKLQLHDPRQMAASVVNRIAGERFHIEELLADMKRGLTDRIGYARHAVILAKAELSARSPSSVLRRGYALLKDKETGTCIRSISLLEKDDMIRIIMHDGSTDAHITTSSTTTINTQHEGR